MAMIEDAWGVEAHGRGEMNWPRQQRSDGSHRVRWRWDLRRVWFSLLLVESVGCRTRAWTGAWVGGVLFTHVYGSCCFRLSSLYEYAT